MQLETDGLVVAGKLLFLLEFAPYLDGSVVDKVEHQLRKIQ
jgi:hypothetical protein